MGTLITRRKPVPVPVKPAAGRLHAGPWCEIVSESIRYARLLPGGPYRRILRSGTTRVTIITEEVKP